MQFQNVIFTAIVLLLEFIPAITIASQPTDCEIQRLFTNTLRPFLQTHCLACHDKEKQKGMLDLSTYSTMAAVAKDHHLWELVLEKLESEEMPPEEASRQPTPDERQAVINSIRALREHQARRQAGDPGPVPARRLSNAEYDYTIRDLTGVDIRPTREFPLDPTNTAGFDNSGESLAMSPALLTKYLAAARYVADHIVLKPKGFVFAPHPVVTETDRDKYCVRRIVDFYHRQRIDYADYFLAAWRFRHRDGLGKPVATLADFAAEAGISSKYLTTIWSILTQTQYELRPLATLQTMWRELPTLDVKHHHDTVRLGCEEMRNVVIRKREQFAVPERGVGVYGISMGSQPLVLWKNRQLAENRMRYNKPSTTPNDDPAAARREEACSRFCEIFPDSFFVSQRDGVINPSNRKEGRLLSAGFHLMVGYFRDDEPLYKLILDEQGQHQLDTLWQELDFITFAPNRQYKDFIFFERAEPIWFMQEAKFDFARAEDKDVTTEAMIQRLAEVYLAKAHETPDSQVSSQPHSLDSGKQGSRHLALQAIEAYFTNISAAIRWVEQTRLTARPSHLETLENFAQRAYRRPLLETERGELLAFYRSLRKAGLGHEDAIRDTVVSVLISPYFCYRVDLPQAGEAAGPLSDYALASRLSYFLWSSMPDAELLDHAAAGNLHRSEILLSQTKRMLRDRRSQGLAVEFGGNWLDFRHFEQHNSVDRELFKSFTNRLRQSMYEEPIRFFVDLVHRDGSVIDFLDAEHTFVNPVLAKHYGMPIRNVGPDDWVRVDDAHQLGRGGLLAMSVFLTQNSPGRRTSPVKRGYWVVRRVLGEHIPPPPPEVPELPEDEAKLGDLTLRQLMARHREIKSCAGCHERFDSIGLVFEGYDPIGQRRDKDLGGRPVDTQATFPNGHEGTGLDGLRNYLREHRQEEFVDNLCRKLLVYALGRSLQLSDETTIQYMRDQLADDNHRFGSLVETIVTSPQFLNKRGRDHSENR